MRLADFIDREERRILSEWEAFAATRLPAASSMTAWELRNHASQILHAISADLRTAQSGPEQIAKSQGLAPVLAQTPHTAAQVHGIMRARSGFDINQMVSEYRALRASVLRLWASSHDPADLPGVIEDMIRFNEAIDQAIAESVALFTEEVERGRNLFLGVLGHELRSPLNAIRMTARYLSRITERAEVTEAVGHLSRGGERMKGLLDDLLVYSRSRLYLGIVVRPTQSDLAQICASVMEELRVTDPDSDARMEVTGEVSGFWDARRLHQVLSNLLGNAMSYRAPGTPVVVNLTGSADEVTVAVSNAGPMIPEETLRTLFEPLQRGRGAGWSREEGSHLGLGLFVAREIVKAHRGRLEAVSREGETVFEMRLPRRTE